MDITEVCKFFPEVCTVLGFAKITGAVAIIGGLLFSVIFWYIGEWKRAQKRCPKCQKKFLKEMAFTNEIPTFGPHGESGIYRQLYLTCTCGYTQKLGEPELVCKYK